MAVNNYQRGGAVTLMVPMLGAMLAVSGNRIAYLLNGGSNAEKVDDIKDSVLAGFWDAKGAGFAILCGSVCLVALPSGFDLIMSSQSLSKEFALLLGCAAAVTGLVQCVHGMRMFEAEAAQGI